MLRGATLTLSLSLLSRSTAHAALPCSCIRFASAAAATKSKPSKPSKPVLKQNVPGSSQAQDNLTDDEMLEEKEKAMLDRMKRMGLPRNHNDLMLIPELTVVVPVKWRSVPVGIRPQWRWLRDSLINSFSNALALVNLARWGYLPRVPHEKQPASFWQRWFTLRPYQARSTSKSSWLAPFLKQAMQMYKDINTAAAEGGQQTIWNLCRDDYAQTMLKRMNSIPRGVRLHWQLHREVSPTRVVFIRAMDTVDLEGQTLYIMQAVVKFDTMQSLVVKQVDSRAGGARPVAPEPKHVVEYLLFEGRMKDPFDKFQVRAQLYEDSVRFSRAPEKKKKPKSD